MPLICWPMPLRFYCHTCPGHPMTTAIWEAKVSPWGSQSLVIKPHREETCALTVSPKIRALMNCVTVCLTLWFKPVFCWHVFCFRGCVHNSFSSGQNVLELSAVVVFVRYLFKMGDWTRLTGADRDIEAVSPCCWRVMSGKPAAMRASLSKEMVMRGGKCCTSCETRTAVPYVTWETHTQAIPLSQ